MALTFALCAAFAFALSFVSYRWLEPTWIDEVRTRWITVNAVSGAAAAAIGTTVCLVSGVAFDYRVASIVLLAWLLVLVAFTDYTAYRIPRGSSRMAIIASLAIFVWSTIESASLSERLAVSGAALIVPLLFFMVQGMGMGDIRLFVVFAIALPWWTTLSGWFYALGIAAGLGILSFGVAKVLRRGTRIDYTKGRIRSVLTGSNTQKQTTRKAIPFGPALTAGYLGYAIFALVSQGSELPSSMLM